MTNSFQDYSEDSAAALDILDEQAEFECGLAEFQAAVNNLAYGVPLEPLPVSLKDKLFARLEISTKVLPKPANLLDLMDLSVNELRQVAIDLPQWESFPMPISSEMVVWHVDEVNAQIAFFLRIYEPGMLPQHWHATGESILVLEGNFIDDDGTVFKVGDRFVAAANTSHQPSTSMGCLILAVTSIHDKILSPV